jgi:hypothetical protein
MDIVKKLPRLARKGNVGGMSDIVIGLAFFAIAFFVAGFIIALGASLNTQLGSGYAVNTTAWNVTQNVNSGYNTFGSNMPLIATVGVAVIIITLIVGVFFVFRRSDGGGM